MKGYICGVVFFAEMGVNSAMGSSHAHLKNQ